MKVVVKKLKNTKFENKIFLVKKNGKPFEEKKIKQKIFEINVFCSNKTVNLSRKKKK